MFTMVDNESDKDYSRVRTLDFGTNRIHIECTDPFGFWYIKIERGQLPEKLRGAYTEFDKAEAAVKHYLAEKGKTLKE